MARPSHPGPLLVEETTDEPDHPDLPGLVEWLLDRWPDTTVGLVDQLRATPVLVYDQSRAELLRGARADVRLRWQEQRSALNAAAATAAEHEVSWRLGKMLINTAASLRLQQLSELWQLEKQQREERLLLLGGKAAVEDPLTLPVELRRAAEETARSMVTEDDETAAVSAAPHGLPDDVLALLDQWTPLLREQRKLLATVAERHRATVQEMQADQRKQLATRRQAVHSADEYANNLAASLVAVGFLIGATALALMIIERHGLTGTLILGVSIGGLLSVLLAGSGGAVFRFRSAGISVLPEKGESYEPPGGQLRPTGFVLLLLPTLIVFVIVAGLLLLMPPAGVLGRVFGPIILGVAVVFAIVAPIMKRPRSLTAALREHPDDILDAGMVDDFGAGGRYGVEMQRWADFVAQIRQQCENQARFWNRVALWLGLPATVLTAVGAATGFTDLTRQGAGKYIVASLTLLGSTITAVAASLGAAGKAESASTRARSYASLGREMRTVRRLDIRPWLPPQRRAVLEDFLKRLNALDGVTDQASYYERNQTASAPTTVAAAAAQAGTQAAPAGSNPTTP